MRVILWFCSALMGACLLGGSQQTLDTSTPSNADPYLIAFVNSAMEFFKDFANEKGHFTFETKKYTNLSPSLLKLGDAVSVAALKVYEPDELIRPENANAYLTVVRIAFSDPRSVIAVRESDRDPKVTLFVLEYLKVKEVSNPELEKRIADTKQCVTNFTCVWRSEAAVF